MKMRQLLLIVAAAAFAGCAAEVVGPYSKSLSPEDLQQIRAIALVRSDIHHKRVVYVHAIRPGCVFVEATPNMLGGLLKSTFIACKRGDKWIIKKSSVQNYDEVIVTA
jgi:hypothetical protein